MSFCQFNFLPTELQLEVLRSSESKSLLQFMQSNKFYSNMVKYTVHSKLSNYLKPHDFSTSSEIESDADSESSSVPADPETLDKLFVGIFSPQSAAKKVELYETKTAVSSEVTTQHTNSLESSNSRRGSVVPDSVDMNEVINRLKPFASKQSLSPEPSFEDCQCEEPEAAPSYLDNTIIKLGHLEKTRDPLARKSEFVKVVNTATTNTEEETDSNRLHLIINEDSKIIKLQFDLYFEPVKSNLHKLFSVPTRISSEMDTTEEIKHINLLNGAVSIHCKVSKGEEVPPSGPYDYDLFYNYYVDVLSIQINNLFLLDCIEKTH